MDRHFHAHLFTNRDHRLEKIDQVLPQLVVIHRAIFGKQGLHFRQPFRLPARQREAV